MADRERTASVRGKSKTRSRGVVLGAVISALTACALAPAAASAGTLDQQQAAVGATAVSINSGNSVFQSFTAGLSGKLDQVDLSLRKAGAPASSLTVELRSVAATDPTSTVLASAVVPASGVSTTAAFVPITFAVPAPVLAGTPYAIVAYSAAAPGTDYRWSFGPTNNLYPGGFAADTPTSPPTGAWSAYLADLAFKTYVVPAITPGPTRRRAAALKKCKKKHKKNHNKKKFKKCKKKANRLPV
jgi:hypothetical protein